MKFLNEQKDTFKFLTKWLLLSVVIAIFVGSVSAFFLFALKDAARIRESNLWIVFLLPVVGYLISLAYAKLSPESEKGNNLVIEETIEQKKALPIWMAPLVLFGTIFTHLFGGSAGREGTAVQIGATLSDQLQRVVKFTSEERKILLVCGVAAGFSSVFGTPVAGLIFGLEMAVIGRQRYEAIVPALFSALLANYVTLAWDAPHTHYHIHGELPFTWYFFLWVVLAGIFFGFAGRAFSKLVTFFSKQFSRISKNNMQKSFIGGAVVVLGFLILKYGGFYQPSRYLGLGVPVIVETFHNTVPWYDFLLKLLFTTVTLGAGFKGGEVTPLFFIGATLGSALSLVIPIPFDVLAGIGFVAVFAAAANTPIACIIMGVELFGSEHLSYIALGCITAYLFSGHSGIYKSQILAYLKAPNSKDDKRKKIGDL